MQGNFTILATKFNDGHRLKSKSSVVLGPDLIHLGRDVSVDLSRRWCRRISFILASGDVQDEKTNPNGARYSQGKGGAPSVPWGT